MFGRQKFKVGQKVTVTMPADEGGGSFDGVIELISADSMEVLPDDPAVQRLIGNWNAIPSKYWNDHVKVRN